MGARAEGQALTEPGARTPIRIITIHFLHIYRSQGVTIIFLTFSEVGPLVFSKIGTTCENYPEFVPISGHLILTNKLRANMKPGSHNKVNKDKYWPICPT